MESYIYKKIVMNKNLENQQQKQKKIISKKENSSKLKQSFFFMGKKKSLNIDSIKDEQSQIDPINYKLLIKKKASKMLKIKLEVVEICKFNPDQISQFIKNFLNMM